MILYRRIKDFYRINDTEPRTIKVNNFIQKKAKNEKIFRWGEED